MGKTDIRIRMLGGFYMEEGGHTVSGQEPINISGRARRIWSLIEYLIIHRDREVPVTELVDILWMSQEREDPLRTLQHNVSRARDMLEKMGISAARELIIAKNGGYRWNPQRPTWVDAEEFESLVLQARRAPEEETALELSRKALELYRGDFLPGMGMEAWVTPLNAYYRSLYISQCLFAVRVLGEREQWAEVAALCEPAESCAEDAEELAVWFVRALTAMDQPGRALAVYEQTKKRLQETLDIVPSEELEIAREEAAKKLSGEKMDAAAVKKLLEEDGYSGGAFFCDWSTFRNLVRRQARALVRNPMDVQLLVATLEGDLATPTDSKRLERVLTCSLRSGDSFTRLNATQFIAMLPDTTSENIAAISRRLNDNFTRLYPRSRARIRYGHYRLEKAGLERLEEQQL